MMIVIARKQIVKQIMKEPTSPTNRRWFLWAGLTAFISGLLGCAMPRPKHPGDHMKDQALNQLHSRDHGWTAAAHATTTQQGINEGP